MEEYYMPWAECALPRVAGTLYGFVIALLIIIFCFKIMIIARLLLKKGAVNYAYV